MVTDAAPRKTERTGAAYKRDLPGDGYLLSLSRSACTFWSFASMTSCLV
jgi:hypothetical protein